MATNNIIAFADTAAGTDIYNDAQYVADTDSATGNKAGIAKRKLNNKALKQATKLAAGVAQFIANNQANNITDALTVANIAAYLQTAIASIGGISQAAADARYVNIGYLMARDEKATNTSGGTPSVGTNTRVLNTLSSNTISGAGLASNQITLPAGTYRINASVPAFEVDRSKVFLYNVTDSANTIVGTNIDNVTGAQTDGTIKGRFAIASTKVFEIRHVALAASSSGFGNAANAAGLVEVYTQVEIIKES